MKTTAEILREARELYAAAPSHCPGDEYPEEGTCCPITAFVDVATDRHDWDNERNATVLLAEAAGIHTTRIPAWNHATSTADVLATFDRAIAQAEAS